MSTRDPARTQPVHLKYFDPIAMAPLLALLFVWALYLSIVNVGQIFYAFGWESLLLAGDRVLAPVSLRADPRRAPDFSA
jgi:hypothetical protein